MPTSVCVIILNAQRREMKLHTGLNERKSKGPLFNFIFYAICISIIQKLLTEYSSVIV